MVSPAELMRLASQGEKAFDSAKEIADMAKQRVGAQIIADPNAVQASPSDLLAKASQAAEIAQARTFDASRDKLTTPLSTSLNTMERAQKIANIQQQQIKNPLGGLASPIGGLGKLTPDWIDTSVSATPIEIYDIDTGKTVKSYKNAIDYQLDTMVVNGGATAKPSLGIRDLAGAASSVGINAAIGSGVAGGFGAAAGAAIGAANIGTQILEGLSEAYAQFDADPRRSVTLLAEETTDKDGKKVYKVDLEKAGEANTLSGKFTLSQKKIPTDTPVTWNEAGDGLIINVAPGFASSDTYKEYIKDISASLKGLTKNTEGAEDYVRQLNTAINSLQSRYFVDQEEAANIRAMYPNVSEAGIETSINNMLTGYANSDEELEAPIVIFNDNNELEQTTARQLFDKVYDMDKIEKDKFLVRLNTLMQDPTLSDDMRATIMGERQALSAIDKNTKVKKYEGFIRKDLADYLGQDLSFLKLTPSRLAQTLTGGAAYGAFQALEEDEVSSTISMLTTGGLRIAEVLTLTGAAQDLLEASVPTLVGKVGAGAEKLLGAGNIITRGADAFVRYSAMSGNLASLTANSYSDLIGNAIAGGLNVAYQAGADLIYDGIAYGLSELTGGDMDFWQEFSADFAMDLLFSFAHTGLLQDAMKQAGISSLNMTDLSRIVRDNAEVKIDPATKTKTITMQIEGRPDLTVKVDQEQLTKKQQKETTTVNGLTATEFKDAVQKAYYEVNFEAQQRAAQFIVKLHDLPIVNKIYSAVADDAMNMKILGYRSLAETGDYTDLIKLSNNANASRVYMRVQNEFLQGAARSAYEGLNKAQLDYRAATGYKQMSEEGADYLNSKQAWERAQIDHKKGSAEYTRIEKLYNDALNGVSETERVALDAIGDALVKFAQQIGKFEQLKGLQTANFFENIQKYPNYFPLFLKSTGSGGRPVEWRQTHKSSDSPEVLFSPKAFDNPVSSTMRYMEAVMRNATRAERVNTVLEVIEKIPGLSVSENSTLKQDFEKLPVSELTTKYNMPSEVSATLHKLADTETSYQKAISTIMEKTLIAQHIEEFQKAKGSLAQANDDATLYRTVDGDPLLKKTTGIYKKGMSEAEMREVFLDQLELDVQTMLSLARRRNYKFRKYYTEDARSHFETIMGSLYRNIDRWDGQDLLANLTKSLTDAMPMHTYDELVYGWVNNSAVRQEELLADPDILEGRAGYDVAKNRKVMRNEAAVRVMTDGRIDTLYIEGETKADREMAKGVAEVLNAPISEPLKNGFMRVLSNTAMTTARIKRESTSGMLPSRAPVNKVRDTGQAAMTVGSSALVSPLELFKSLIEPGRFEQKELDQIFAVLDSVATISRASTEVEVLNAYRYGTTQEALTLANRPEAPGFKAKYEARPGERTLNQLEYQFKLFTYNAKRAGKGGLKDILMTPGNIAEASTRAQVGQNMVMIELVRRLEAGEDFQKALSNAYEKGAWASRNATTDFATKGWLTRELSRFTPFSYSSFSDVASKLEAFVMNPTGVSSRTLTAMTAYTINLMALLADEDNRKRYMNMSAYQRENTIPIDLGDGKLLTLPIEQGFSGLLSPIRKFVETLAYNEPVTFWKVLGAFGDVLPIDVSGFTEGDTFNLWRGLEKGTDTYAPALATFALEQLTGRDFYYGENISVDERTLAQYGLSADSAGDFVRADKDNSVLHAIADFLDIPQWRLEHVYNQFTGTVGNYVLHYLDKLQGATDNEAYGKGIAQAFYKSFLPTTSGASTAFYQGIDALREEKLKIMDDLSANWKAQLTATGSARIELQQKRQKILDDFALKVTDFISGYLNVYEQTGGLSRSEASSIYYLFDFTDDFEGGGFNVGTAGSQAYEDYKSQAGLQASALSSQAIGTNYDPRGLYQKADGTWERETPLGTQAMQRLLNNRNKEYAASINRLAADNNLSQAKSVASQRISDIYNKAETEGRKPTNEEYAQMDAIRAELDVKAAVALAPFFKANGLDMISSNAVAEELGQYFLVIGDEMKNNKGRYISASDLNKQRGFVQSFVKKIYEKAGIK